MWNLKKFIEECCKSMEMPALAREECTSGQMRLKMDEHQSVMSNAPVVPARPSLMRRWVALMTLFVKTGTFLYKFLPGNWMSVSDPHILLSRRFSSIPEGRFERTKIWEWWRGQRSGAFLAEGTTKNIFFIWNKEVGATVWKVYWKVGWLCRKMTYHLYL